MLMNNFFEIKEKTVSEARDKAVITSQIIINKSHKIFEGHFPNQPIVPGVCMIQLIKEILENHLNSKLVLSSASNIKFLSVINPEINNILNVEISYTNSDTPFDVDARLYWGEIMFFKIKGVFKV